ncbi:MAG TPA: BON domain-containing protein [Candidatus Acidoferrales bacterium]|nr:BON domain-containing protein [Candidatus Acidoferrales bacterium]
MRNPFMRIAQALFLVLLTSSYCSMAAGAIQDQDKKAPTHGSANYDAWLTKEVRHELLMLPYYSVFDNLEYQVNGYDVLLTGQVARPSLKDDAESSVKRLEGVEHVINKIEVLPVSPNDDRIRRAEFHAIYSRPPLERYALGAVPPIHIIVKNGNVTLEGVVATEADKEVAGIAAKGVSDVFSVTNNLRVDEKGK